MEPLLSLVEDWLVGHDTDARATARDTGAVASQASSDTVLHLESYDYSTAFERCSPRICRALLDALGIPTYLCQQIHASHTQQWRHIEMGPLVSQSPILVTDSLPQGCPLPPVLQALLLMPANRRLLAQTGSRDTCFVMYSDDRSIGSTSSEDVRIARGIWTSWSPSSRSAPTTRRRRR